MGAPWNQLRDDDQLDGEDKRRDGGQCHSARHGGLGGPCGPAQPSRGGDQVRLAQQPVGLSRPAGHARLKNPLLGTDWRSQLGHLHAPRPQPALPGRPSCW